MRKMAFRLSAEKKVIKKERRRQERKRSSL
jgi:hypothetical protein